MIKLPLPPGTLLSLYNNHERFEDSYMKNVPGYYDTGDAGLIDEGRNRALKNNPCSLFNFTFHYFQMATCL